MDSIKKFLLGNKYNLILLIIYLIITVFTMFHHEVWRDEAQVWCIVRDLNIIDIFQTARIEGHPILWYLLVMPFAKMGLSVISMQILSLLLVFSSVIFFVFKAPFNKFFKTIFIFGAGMLYYIPIIARNYALLPIIVFLIAYLYKDRAQKPYLYAFLLILLTHTHALMFGFSAILFVLFAIEQVKTWLKTKDIKQIIPLILVVVNFLIIGVLFFNIVDVNTAISSYNYRNYSIIQTMLNYAYGYFNPWDIYLLLIVLWVAFVYIGYKFFTVDKNIFIIYVFNFIYVFYVFNKVWFGGIPYQKIFIPFLIIVFCLWLLKEENKKVDSRFFYILVYSLFIISLFTSYIAIKQEIKYNFSGAKELANYIKTNLPDEENFIFAGRSYTISPISAYNPKLKIYNLGTNDYITYYDFKNYNKKSINPPKTNYWIFQYDYEFNTGDGYELIYKTSRENLSSQIECEKYIIYKIKEQRGDI